MRRARVVFFLVTLLVTSSFPLVSASEGRATVCETIDMSTMPDPIIIPDQDCRQISLGILAQGTIVEFDVTGDVNFDFLVFRNAALQAYANDHSYRSPVYWAEETVFEEWFDGEVPKICHICDNVYRYPVDNGSMITRGLQNMINRQKLAEILEVREFLTVLVRRVAGEFQAEFFRYDLSVEAPVSTRVVKLSEPWF